MKALLPAIAIAALASAAPVRAADETPHYREVLGAPAGPALLGPALDARQQGRVGGAALPGVPGPLGRGLALGNGAGDARAGARDDGAGYDEEQILTYFERSYGEFVRLEPRREASTGSSGWRRSARSRSARR